MTFKSRSSTITLPSDVVFEPYSEMRTVEGTDTLVIHLPEFRKEQLRVQVNNQGVLKVSGEKPEGEDGKRKTRFLKEAKIPRGCDINHIRAKFVAGHLHVIMPVKAPSPPDNQQEQPPKTSSTTQATEPNALTEQKLEASRSRNGVMTKDNGFGIGNSLARFQVQKKVTVNLGVAVVALVAIGAYVAYTYGTSSSSSSSSSPPSQIED
ncbi:uncharacterized protein LOC141609268 [Silene latifolia]|uniref:uncharacterized protein LOC141609268 n=1 Tax=Silene latifolia TaxID=37657 RepID=UPI003D782E00